MSKNFDRKDRQLRRGSILRPTSEIFEEGRFIKRKLSGIKTQTEFNMTLSYLKLITSPDIFNAYSKHPEIFQNL